MKYAYVYYRIDPAQATLAANQVDCLLKVLAGFCRHPPRRFSRCDAPDTWMETYEDIADYTAFTAALNAAVLSLECATFTQGERHLECFSAPDLDS